MRFSFCDVTKSYTINCLTLKWDYQAFNRWSLKELLLMFVVWPIISKYIMWRKYVFLARVRSWADKNICKILKNLSDYMNIEMILIKNARSFTIIKKVQLVSVFGILIMRKTVTKQKYQNKLRRVRLKDEIYFGKTQIYYWN